MTTPHGLVAKQKIETANDHMHPRQVWSYRGDLLKLIVFNRREGIVKYFNTTKKTNGSMCVAWLFEHGQLIEDLP